MPPPMPRDRTVPPRPRRWRLWLYAVIVTGLAGGAGYLAWTFRQARETGRAQLTACQGALAPVQLDARTKGEKLTTCETELGKVTGEQRKHGETLASMESNLSATREELTALRAQRAATEKQVAAMAEIQAQFARMIDTGQLQVSARRGSLVVELPAEVLFPSASSQLSEKGELAVLEVGIILKRFPDRRFLVVGHTDNVPLKSTPMTDNWELSTARALTVTRFLVKAGMQPDALVPAGQGEHEPVADNDTPAGRQRNRRIEIVLLPAITELPPLPTAEKPAEKAPEKANAKPADKPSDK